MRGSEGGDSSSGGRRERLLLLLSTHLLLCLYLLQSAMLHLIECACWAVIGWTDAAVML